MKAHVIVVARTLCRCIIRVGVLNVTCILHNKHITTEIGE
jgi:hypothetical protein